MGELLAFYVGYIWMEVFIRLAVLAFRLVQLAVLLSLRILRFVLWTVPFVHGPRVVRWCRAHCGHGRLPPPAPRVS